MGTACMASRVAVVGANGAGKSTAIKLLIGELKPESGQVWRHQNMRLAYVAQHAFHHLEKHLDKTPVEYIMWRFAGADDRESLENASMDTTDDDGKKREQPWYICPKTFDLKKCDMTDTKEGKKTRDDAVVPDAIINRQKNTKTKKYIYEVKWQHKGMDSNSWQDREILLAMGYSKDKVSGAGRLTEVGAALDDTAMEDSKGPDEVYDESGNKIIVKKKMDTKEIKKAIKEIEKKQAADKKKPALTEEEGWELGDRLEELKQMLVA